MKYLFYKVNPQDIARIKFIIESYDNLMSISTIDPEISKIQVTIAPDFFDDCLEILNDLSKKFTLIRLNEPDCVSQGNY